MLGSIILRNNKSNRNIYLDPKRCWVQSSQ